MRVLDVGAGPGARTAGLARRVGAGRVAAADPSEPFVGECRARIPGVDVRLAAVEEPARLWARRSPQIRNLSCASSEWFPPDPELRRRVEPPGRRPRWPPVGVVPTPAPPAASACFRRLRLGGLPLGGLGVLPRPRRRLHRRLRGGLRR
ncbi:class I SAM-dependent methyltransferase [Gaiella occulta]|uniref:class I SAM-dependent methyltransferase n=1 Tax=Gaiella occulta TaxID=1002870 RepID=UPI000E0C6581